MRHTGSCHCGAIVIEVEAPEDIEASECNCSICQRLGFLHLIVAADDLTLVQGADAITSYRFNTGVAQHYFCRHCGCKPYYLPRSHPGGFSVNVRCLDKSTIRSLTVKAFDGQNWEANAGKLKPLP